VRRQAGKAADATGLSVDGHIGAGGEMALTFQAPVLWGRAQTPPHADGRPAALREGKQRPGSRWGELLIETSCTLAAE
jgi:hypothetical protein